MASKLRKPLPEDVARLGREMATYKRNNPRAWKKLVKTAHSRGFTVAAQFSGVPDPLKERTRTSLKKQALRTVNAAYAPDETELDEQGKRIAAINAKRAADENTYQAWLQTQQQAIITNAQAADAELVNRTAAAQQTAQQAWSANQAQAQQALADTPGTVSDPSQARALDLSAAAQKANAQAAAETSRTAQSVAASGTQLRTLQSASLANGQAQRATIQADTTKANADLFDARVKLKLTKAADSMKEVTRLYDAETEKANANRDYAAATEKLGIQAEGQRLDAKAKERDYKLAEKKLTLAQLIAEDDRAADEARIKVDYDKLAQDKGKAAADRALKRELEASRTARAKERDKTAKGKVTAGQRKDSASAIKRVSSISRDISRLHKKKGLKRPIREVLAAKGASDIEIDVANDLWKNKGKLSPAGRRKARSIGIIVPSYWIP